MASVSVEFFHKSQFTCLLPCLMLLQNVLVMCVEYLASETVTDGCYIASAEPTGY